MLSSPSQRWELLETCFPMLKGYIRRLARDRDSAHDLMQETCLRVLGSETAPTDAHRFSMWCCGVARNIAAQQHRNGPLDPGSYPELLASDPVDPERHAYVAEKLAQTTGNLDAECLELLVRHYVFDEKICDLADERTQSAASLRMRLMRLRQAMRAVRE